MNRNPYDVLGVEKHASPDDIKKAFKKMAQQYHPDRNPNDASAEERFKEVSDAYAILSNEGKKADYDLNTAFTNSHVRSGSTGGSYHDVRHVSNADFRQVIDDLFGRHGSERTSDRPHVQQPQQGTWNPSHDISGEDVEVKIEITLEESIHGCKKQIKVQGHRSTVPCQACGGTGGQPGTRTMTCSACAGHGRGVSPNGTSAQVRKCVVCRGRGSVPLVPCKTCSGRGLGVYEKEITVKVPSGINSGQQLRISGMGTPGHPPGDLYVEVRILDGGKFRREGMNIHCNVRITLPQAILGGHVSFNGPDGAHMELPIPSGTQPGDELKVSGAGVKGALSHTHGDFIAHIMVSLPKVLSPRAKKLLEEFGAEIARPPGSTEI